MMLLLESLRAELARIAGDKAAVVVLIGASIFYALFYPLPYQEQVARGVPVVVVDHDRSQLSRKLIRMVDATEQITVTAVIADENQAQRLVRSSEVHGMLLIPREFERDVMQGRQVMLGAFANAAYMLMYSQIATGLNGAVGTLNIGIKAERLRNSGAPPGPAQPLAVDVHELFNPGGGYGTYVVPAVLVLILQQTFLIGICMVGSNHCKPSPVRITFGREVFMLGGRALAYLIIYVLLLLFYLLVVYGLYDFPRRGGLVTLFIFMLPFFLAVIFLGISLSALFANRETALQVLMLISVPMLFLAGFAWPVDIMPRTLAWLGQLLPTTPAIDGFVRINQMGASLNEVAARYAQLWLLAGGFGLTAWMLVHPAVIPVTFSEAH